MKGGVRQLSPRHQQVAELLISGASAEAISSELGVSLNTAKYYITVVQRYQKVVRAAEAGSRVPLTPREAEIAALLETGATNRDIADRLDLSVRTVESHVLNISRKLGPLSREAITRELVPDSGLGALSFRELEVLHLIARSLSHADVARRLDVDERTVETHVYEIRKKLGIPGNRSLARFGMGQQ